MGVRGCRRSPKPALALGQCGSGRVESQLRRDPQRARCSRRKHGSHGRCLSRTSGPGRLDVGVGIRLVLGHLLRHAAESGWLRRLRQRCRRKLSRGARQRLGLHDLLPPFCRPRLLHAEQPRRRHGIPLCPRRAVIASPEAESSKRVSVTSSFSGVQWVYMTMRSFGLAAHRRETEPSRDRGHRDSTPWRP